MTSGDRDRITTGKHQRRESGQHGGDGHFHDEAGKYGQSAGKVTSTNRIGKFRGHRICDHSVTLKGPVVCRMPFAIWHGTRIVLLRQIFDLVLNNQNYFSSIRFDPLTTL